MLAASAHLTPEGYRERVPLPAFPVAPSHPHRQSTSSAAAASASSSPASFPPSPPALGTRAGLSAASPPPPPPPPSYTNAADGDTDGDTDGDHDSLVGDEPSAAAASSSGSRRGSTVARLAALLECSICLEEMRQPTTLPCGHNFCLGCLQAMVEHLPPQQNFFCCPMDRYRFPRNFPLRQSVTLARILELLNQSLVRRRSASEPPPSSSSSLVPCAAAGSAESDAVAVQLQGVPRQHCPQSALRSDVAPVRHSRDMYELAV